MEHMDTVQSTLRVGDVRVLLEQLNHCGHGEYRESRNPILWSSHWLPCPPWFPFPV